ncbi:MAG: NAD(P)H-dependent oxidoreductase, partial [Deltaproteobacteria bacterium]|nr:NAD(P)H-dependent oxidoreductase [Deltaproteobacteria bacterium]
MDVLVLYYSKGGNTKRLAQAVAEGVNSVDGAAAVVKDTAEVTKDDFVNCAGIVAGSPVYFGVMASELKKVFDDFVSVRKQMEGKVGAAFTTGGGVNGGMETTIFSIIACFLIYDMVEVGDPMTATGHYSVGCVGEPDEKATENAKKL